ncbi:hypothetical protein BDF20DRAFT_601319 [Mycotypha africana]|uniref:uncharacterized protein n=1 Tax=Mycotypha africana TaxID=64632 RepID=UPI0023015881|nr:uncharacterized protein BDF20DRAFT_601319 [Mycotypha africana]KAI8975359.1 hypothetical protein BDF20DRAFT_601319 [Mycotypha africana]
MANSPSLRFLNHFKNGKGEKKEKSETVAPTVQVSKPSTHQSTVQGWLKSVRSYGQATTKDPISVPLDVDNYSNLIDNDQTNDVKIRPGSLTSEDSVNLDELINANYTSDVDNETDLPDLGELDIDDSVDDFWRLDKVIS